MVPCSLPVSSDPRLLEQMIRNLLSNALKYTRQGKVLLGCRRRKDMLSIEVWDTGIGIPEAELEAIFEEYHQLDNAARQRSRGLGLGLSIVRRLGDLLGHRVHVRSRLGKGSVFAIDVASPPDGTAPQIERRPLGAEDGTAEGARRTGVILVVEDDPEVCDVLALLLSEEGHHVTTTVDGVAALEWMTKETVRPDLILLDYNLPNDMTGLQVAAKLRETAHREIPVVILTADISTEALRDISAFNCIQLNKPVKVTELRQVIQGLLPLAVHAPPPAEKVRVPKAPVIFLVDDDRNVREGLRAVLEEAGLAVEDYATCEVFLEAYRPGRDACLLIDAYLPGMSGLELLQRLRDAGDRLPSVMITGNSDVTIAVQAMQAGALDFIQKPVGRGELLASIERALDLSRDSSLLDAQGESARNIVAALTPRQQQIMEEILAGHPNKNIAADLGISQRTVENHRAAIMKKTGSASLPALARLAVAAFRNGADEAPAQTGPSARAAR